MTLRKTTSLTTLTSFILLLFTSIILYVTPQGKIAFWANWKMLGIGKEEWGALHTNLGFLAMTGLFREGCPLQYCHGEWSQGTWLSLRVAVNTQCGDHHGILTLVGTPRDDSDFSGAAFPILVMASPDCF